MRGTNNAPLPLPNAELVPMVAVSGLVRHHRHHWRVTTPWVTALQARRAPRATGSLRPAMLRNRLAQRPVLRVSSGESESQELKQGQALTKTTGRHSMKLLICDSFSANVPHQAIRAEMSCSPMPYPAVVPSLFDCMLSPVISESPSIEGLFFIHLAQHVVTASLAAANQGARCA